MLEREAEGIDAFDDAFLELLAVGLSKVELVAFFARKASIDVGS